MPKAATAFALAALLITSPSVVRADTRGNQLAYNYAMRCFVAEGIRDGDMKRHGATATQLAMNDRYARKSYDLAYSLGAKIGFSKKRISADMDSFQRSETRRLLLETDYFKSTWDDCVKLELMEPPLP